MSAMKILMIILVATLLMVPLASDNASATEDTDQFFGRWVGSLTPIVQNITGTADSAEIFHVKLLQAGATFNMGITYVRAHGTTNDKNHLAWDSMAYMWPYIRVAYPDETLPTWDSITVMLSEMSVDRDNFYEGFIATNLEAEPQQLASVNGALDTLYAWLQKNPETDFTTIILMVVVLVFSIMISIGRDLSFNGTMFLVGICINVTVAIWLHFIPLAFVILPIMIFGVMFFRHFDGGGNE
jgi:hypothetical protein